MFGLRYYWGTPCEAAGREPSVPGDSPWFGKVHSRDGSGGPAAYKVSKMTETLATVPPTSPSEGSSWSFSFVLGRRLITIAVPPHLLVLLLLIGAAGYLLGGSQATQAQRRQDEMMAILKERNQQLERSLQAREQERDQMQALAEERWHQLCGELESRDSELRRLWLLLGQPSSGPRPYTALSSRGAAHGPAVALKERYQQLQSRIASSRQEVERLDAAAQRYRAKYTPSMVPCKGDMTSGFGYRIHPLYGIGKLHSGCDFTTDYGTAIHATAAGKVIRADWYGGYGKCVEIEHGFGLSTLYAHCEELDVKKGQTVRKGQVIARVGTTGLSSGPHCHYEVHRKGKAINPRPYLPR